MITIVTATYNSERQLPALIASLRSQTDRDFEWVVTDGASTDGTLQLVAAAADLHPVVSSQPDFGIYDALNRALRLASRDYYIITGADDILDRDAIANFKQAINASGADIVAARARTGQRYISVRKGPVWLNGAHAFIANHSLSSAFRRSLHQKYGFFSRGLPIAADALFVIQAMRGGTVLHEADFVAGTVGDTGVSASDWAGSATEFFRVQLATGCSFPMQVLLLFLRLLKGWSSHLRGLVNTVRKLT